MQQDKLSCQLGGGRSFSAFWQDQATWGWEFGALHMCDQGFGISLSPGSMVFLLPSSSHCQMQYIR